MRRLVNRLLALITGLALAAAAALVIVEAVAVLIGKGPLLVDWPAAAGWVRRTAWGDRQALAVSLLLLASGAALVLAQLWPARVRRLPIDTADPATDAAISRRTLARDVTAAVQEVDGVVPERVKVGRTRISVRAGAHVADRSALAGQVSAAVRERLDRLRLRRQPRLTVRLSRRGS
ncbi:hypothetical protein Cs7R123_05160 [Catellatospora sp. TT07R-123]|uniref:DUF6286 domain-containing protein n=1 Tax=Catellatospora sp. TT07R-123 TaxID=2733863 RepID=UPI001B025CCA|nr:DUF6286 domain-containing protein [Catellatospora sp. TT07R-123]GHJ43174.1 hypothetical protein Cs7R123_05160 [Catellatospora sp. TT07R-123]